MHILICHERFLFRYGADRVLILLGMGLAKLGHRITVLANRYDRKVVASFAHRIIDVPQNLGPYLDLNELTAEWLRAHGAQVFGGERVDAVFVGGWPFVAAIDYFREIAREVIFIDQGVVPLEGYSEGMRTTLQRLIDLRCRHLPNATLITPVSDFLAKTQSNPHSGGRTRIRRILEGANHMEMDIWSAAQVGAERGKALDIVRRLRAEGRRPIMNAGRWEPYCYKNSDAAFDILPRIQAHHPEATLIVLADPSGFQVPAGLSQAIVPVGSPDDRELQQIMAECDLALSFSRWEGFNLPLAEMQWLGRSVLAFNAGAHPEVIAHPWFLCTDNADMADKACTLLAGGGPDAQQRAEAIARFKQFFTWERFIEEYRGLLPAEHTKTVREAGSSRRVLIDVTNSTRDPANSGVIRVTRRLSRVIQAQACPIFVIWDRTLGTYVFPTKEEFQQLGQFNGPVQESWHPVSAAPHSRTSAEGHAVVQDAVWILFAEVFSEDRFAPARAWAKKNGLHMAAVFYDAIPYLRPDLCNQELRRDHTAYMRGLAGCDLILPISFYSATCLLDFWRAHGLEPSRIETNPLPAEFGGSERAREPRVQDGHQPVSILCVSTLEPRKNHRMLIRACQRMGNEHPELEWKLTLVGNRYQGGDDLAAFVESTAASDRRIEWLGIVDDAKLLDLYRQADLTVYPSVIEGYGMPIVESVWHAKPCICHREGVMAELAAEGGCVTVNVLDEAALADAIHRVASEPALRRKLSTEAVGRPLSTWNEYAIAMLASMERAFTGPRMSAAVPDSSSVAQDRYPTVEEVLYPELLTRDWQMSDSERMALTALLARHRPKCGIEIGTYQGGSLSLLSQFCDAVFSIDIDPKVAENFRYFENVAFLTGDSSAILPSLLAELNRADMPPEFVLIDGDHSAEGIKRDVGCLLDYTPKRPLFVVLHDSFNPGCRRGMLEAGWERSPYLQWIDLDFIPGRIVEHGGSSSGQMWGGLALAYFTPARRCGDLPLRQSGRRLFEAAKAVASNGKD